MQGAWEHKFPVFQVQTVKGKRGDYLERQSDRIRTLKKIDGLLGEKKGLLYGLLFFKSLDLVLGIVQPFFYYLCIDHVIVKGKMGYLPVVIAGYLSVFVLQLSLIHI